MSDKEHRLTDEKLEEMEKRLSAIYSRVEKTVQKKMADYAKSIDEKSAELLQSYKDAETEDEKRKAKKAYIRFYRQIVKSKESLFLCLQMLPMICTRQMWKHRHISIRRHRLFMR